MKNDKKKLKIINKKKFIASISIVTIAIIVVIVVMIKFFYNGKEVQARTENQTTVEKGLKKEEARLADEETKKTEEEAKSKILLVNKKNPIGRDFKPQNLVTPNIRFGSVANPMVEYVTKDVATALEDMFLAAKKDGINLLGVSAYRSYEYQEQVFDDSVRTYGLEHSKKYVATPGTSEHQTGLCIDVLSDEYSSLDAGFENTKAFKWLMENMKNYGFILRYPKGKQDITGYNYEAWHIRYVGVEAAKEISDKNITLEEYLGKV